MVLCDLYRGGAQEEPPPPPPGGEQQQKKKENGGRKDFWWMRRPFWGRGEGQQSTHTHTRRELATPFEDEKKSSPHEEGRRKEEKVWSFGQEEPIFLFSNVPTKRPFLLKMGKSPVVVFFFFFCCLFFVCVTSRTRQIASETEEEDVK